VFELVAEELVRFEERLEGELHSSVAFIEAIGADLVKAGGKRLRPGVAFLTGRLLGAPPEAAMQVALSVELLHSASLLHDDLIDDADTRRGSEAAFRRYGNVVSVMSGDFMLARVLRLLAASGSAGFTSLMAEAAADVCEGEVLQFQVATLQDYSWENYTRVIEGKTAVLLAAASQGVGLVAGADDADLRALRRYGMAFGRAFQLRDDYLDLLGDPQVLGKPVGGDLREGKATHTVLSLLLEHDCEEARAILARRAARPGDVERMAELATAHGAHERTRSEIEAQAEEAVAALGVFAPSPSRAALAALARQEVARLR
jgi:octaprenyl-diphosphate synthase